MHVLIAGCGYVGGLLAHNFIQQGNRVTALRRRSPTSPDRDSSQSPSSQPPSSDIEWWQQDLSKPFKFSFDFDVDHVIFLASPDDSSLKSYQKVYLAGLKNLLEAIFVAKSGGAQRKKPLRFVLVTSTGVYGEADGKWVSEQTQPRPRTATGKILLEAEQYLRKAFSTWGTQVFKDFTVVRFGGIYGPNRMRFCQSVLEGNGSLKKGATQYTNRIHQTDAARLLLHLVSQPKVKPCYIGVDNHPAPYNEVVAWVQSQRGAAIAPLPHKESKPSPRGNKRCQNDLILKTGFEFCFPTYQEGYKPFIEGWLKDSRSLDAP